MASINLFTKGDGTSVKFASSTTTNRYNHASLNYTSTPPTESDVAGYRTTQIIERYRIQSSDHASFALLTNGATNIERRTKFAYNGNTGLATKTVLYRGHNLIGEGANWQSTDSSEIKDAFAAIDAGETKKTIYNTIYHTIL